MLPVKKQLEQLDNRVRALETNYSQEMLAKLQFSLHCFQKYVEELGGTPEGYQKVFQNEIESAQAKMPEPAPVTAKVDGIEKTDSGIIL